MQNYELNNLLKNLPTQTSKIDRFQQLQEFHTELLIAGFRAMQIDQRLAKSDKERELIEKAFFETDPRKKRELELDLQDERVQNKREQQEQEERDKTRKNAELRRKMYGV